ncbi:hypothetical protein O181_003914 [Austropuccinia psidii MF-1]|uniref:Uncharacterized protein n=1 Tax=Austropuccinia psidii MF-1 TaxID=1389203 RepID=A0A9Q3GEB4_9BASI|nr:hypothetical protein [Austropuccinia psidii MF-1]
MPVQHSPHARNTISQARTQAFLTPAPRAPLSGTPAVPQLRAHLDREPIMEGRKRSKQIKIFLLNGWSFSWKVKDIFQRSWSEWQRGGGEFCGRGQI